MPREPSPRDRAERRRLRRPTGIALLVAAFIFGADVLRGSAGGLPLLLPAALLVAGVWLLAAGEPERRV